MWFYQSEFPYDVDQYGWGNENYTAYWVSPDVKSHSANGVGVASNFRDNVVTTSQGFSVPDTPNVKLTNVYTLYLWGIDNGGTTI